MAMALTSVLALALVATPAMAEKGCYSVSQSVEQWTSMYGTSLPADPHYSGMVLAMHTSGYTMSAVGQSASAGVKSLAETGAATELQAEIVASSAAMTSVKVAPTQLTGQTTNLGFADFTMEADSNFPHVSMVTMIAPSPDWYAFGSAMLYENGAFQSKGVNLYAYDAGTDSGTTYTPTPADSATNPQDNITELMSGVEGAASGKRLMMTMTFTPICCYSVTQATEQWTSMYGLGLPADPHYSGMLLDMHTSAYTMSAVGATSSAGLKLLSETGNSDTLKAEIAGLAAGRAMLAIKVAPVQKATQSSKLGFADFRMQASMLYPHVSMATMIAPSPDWYAFGTAMLYENGAFATKTVSMYAYDSGTDSGANYTAADDATSPQGTITELMGGVTGASTTGKRLMMTMQFTPDATCARIVTAENMKSSGEKGCYSVSQTEEQWTSMYGTSLPTDPHYSGMVAAMHTSGYTMSAVGQSATAGVKNVAETGNSAVLQAEIDASSAAMGSMKVAPTKLSGQTTKLGFAGFMMEANSNFPHVSMITMIAPSPDWYAFGSAMLYENGAFQSKEVNLYAYDAGTDSGTTYTATNSATSPQGNIAELMSGVEGATSGKRLMMTMTFTPMCCYSVSQATEQWTSMYGTGLPGDPHYSGMLLGMHTSAYTMSAVGATSSAGLQLLSETGNSDTLKAEIAGLAAGEAMPAIKITPVQKPTQSSNLGFADFRMQASMLYPQVSMATMIAPSPDWYAFGTAMLYENGAFATKTVSMYAYDSGTDSGTTYTAADTATSPQGTITELMSGVTGASTTGKRLMMTIQFTPDATCARIVTAENMKTATVAGAYQTTASMVVLAAIEMLLIGM